MKFLKSCKKPRFLRFFTKSAYFCVFQRESPLLPKQKVHKFIYFSRIYKTQNFAFFTFFRKNAEKCTFFRKNARFCTFSQFGLVFYAHFFRIDLNKKSEKTQFFRKKHESCTFFRKKSHFSQLFLICVKNPYETPVPFFMKSIKSKKHKK